MIDFMVLGGPRSATTWMANWLTTDTTFCLHDPLMEYTLRQLDVMTIPGRRVGISCTSSIMFPEWVLKHPARKIVLYRKLEEINAGLDALGLPPLEAKAHHKRMLALVEGGIELFDWQDVMSPAMAPKIWNLLLPHIPFDPYRHDLLTGFNVQPHFKRLHLGKEAVANLVKRAAELGVA